VIVAVTASIDTALSGAGRGGSPVGPLLNSHVGRVVSSPACSVTNCRALWSHLPKYTALPKMTASYPVRSFTSSTSLTSTLNPASVSRRPIASAISLVEPCLLAAQTNTFMRPPVPALERCPPW
jgi:hypothetical protein